MSFGNGRRGRAFEGPRKRINSMKLVSLVDSGSELTEKPGRVTGSVGGLRS